MATKRVIAYFMHESEEGAAKVKEAADAIARLVRS